MKKQKKTEEPEVDKKTTKKQKKTEEEPETGKKTTKKQPKKTEEEPETGKKTTKKQPKKTEEEPETGKKTTKKQPKKTEEEPETGKKTTKKQPKKAEEPEVDKKTGKKQKKTEEEPETGKKTTKKPKKTEEEPEVDKKTVEKQPKKTEEEPQVDKKTVEKQPIKTEEEPQVDKKTMETEKNTTEQGEAAQAEMKNNETAKEMGTAEVEHENAPVEGGQVQAEVPGVSSPKPTSSPTSPPSSSQLESLCTLMRGQEQMFAQTMLALASQRLAGDSQSESQILASCLDVSIDVMRYNTESSGYESNIVFEDVFVYISLLDHTMHIYIYISRIWILSLRLGPSASEVATEKSVQDLAKAFVNMFVTIAPGGKVAEEKGSSGAADAQVARQTKKAARFQSRSLRALGLMSEAVRLRS